MVRAARRHQIVFFLVLGGLIITQVIVGLRTVFTLWRRSGRRELENLFAAEEGSLSSSSRAPSMLSRSLF